MPPKAGYNHNHRPCSNNTCRTSSVGRWLVEKHKGTCSRPVCLKKVSRLLGADTRMEERFKYIAKQCAEFNKEPDEQHDKDIHKMCLAIRAKVEKLAKEEKEAAAAKKKAEAEEAIKKAEARRAEMMAVFGSLPMELPEEFAEAVEKPTVEKPTVEKPLSDYEDDLMDYEEMGEGEFVDDDENDTKVEALRNI
jgi:hypothetical protein